MNIIKRFLKYILIYMLVLLITSLFVGCELIDPSSDNQDLMYAADYYPLALGNEWLYRDPETGEFAKYAVTALIDTCDDIPIYEYSPIDSTETYGGWYIGRSSYLASDGRLLWRMHHLCESTPYSIWHVLVDPDTIAPGDTLLPNDIDQHAVIVCSTNQSVQVEAGIFDGCYTIKRDEWRIGEFTYSIFAPNVGLISTWETFLLDEDTLKLSKRELVDYHVYNSFSLSTPPPAELPIPMHQANMVESFEPRYSDLREIPNDFLDRYHDWLQFNGSFYYFDFNENEQPDYAWIAWEYPATHQAIIVDLHFGEEVNPPEIEANQYLPDTRYMVLTEPGKTYYWRIDVKHKPDGEETKGQVWSFTTNPLSF